MSVVERLHYVFKIYFLRLFLLTIGLNDKINRHVSSYRYFTVFKQTLNKQTNRFLFCCNRNLGKDNDGNVYAYNGKKWVGWDSVENVKRKVTITFLFPDLTKLILLFIKNCRNRFFKQTRYKFYIKKRLTLM